MKMAHFLPCTKTITSQETVALLLQEVFRHHGLPDDDIISDRCPQFISKFWQHMFKLLHTSCKLSSGYHPETNGQSEHTNHIVEQYLHCFVNYQLDDWVDLLHLAEFAYNNSEHSSTGYSPFFVNIGYHPSWTMLEHPELPTNLAAEDQLTRLQEIQDILSCHLYDAQNIQKKFVDRHRCDSSTTFQVGDRV